ncbi:MFS transporter [Novosphingobium profundi]|uniref:MFS transporter n=1 Tax=Novosphingobium profundi TaxID=1774954 RepID=UPI001BD92BA3|nr:MFS transporter [Novosphingobium profundi]MBT0669550.1 MFS transporter [Novosphingobium profundi]
MKKSAYLGWAIGSFTSSALVSAVGLLHLRFMTDSLGISIAIAGTLAVIAKIYDAVTDPVMGHLGDRTHTRFGQFRPYLLAGGLLSALAIALLFNVPSALTGHGLWVYVGMTLLLYSSAYTMFRIPYLAIGRAITEDFHERSRLMTFSVYGSSLGSFAATSAAPILLSRIGSDRAGHGLVALILAGAIALGGMLAFALLKERRPVHREPRPAGSPRATFAALRTNTPFLCLIGFKLVLFTGFAVHISALPYYTRHVLGVSDSVLGTIFAIQTVLMVISQPLWVRLARQLGRRGALVASGFTCTLAYLVWAMIPTSSPMPMIFIAPGLSGLGTGGVFLGLYTVLTDTMDYAKRAQGENRAGMLAGVFVMVEKGTSAIGMFAFSMVMAWAGFQSAIGSGAGEQPASVKSGLLVTVALAPALASVLATLIMTRYRLPAIPGPASDHAQTAAQTEIAPG